MRYLISKGVEKKLAFTIMESVRKGKGLKDEWEEAMEARSVPKWYINSCKKNQIHVPESPRGGLCNDGAAHRLLQGALSGRLLRRLFHCARPEFDAAFMIHGPEAAAEKMEEIERNPKATQKEKNMLIVLEVCYEMYRRGLRFLPVDLYICRRARNFL
jgi:DNA polymerase-3 subunit alpha (Gram-positive type)